MIKMEMEYYKQKKLKNSLTIYVHQEVDLKNKEIKFKH